MSMIEENILPRIRKEQLRKLETPWNISSTSTPAILSDTLVNALAAVGIQWGASPILTEMEVVVMDTLATTLGLGEDFRHSSGKGGGVIQNTTADALLAVIAAARVKRRLQSYLGGDCSYQRSKQVLSDEREAEKIYFDDLASITMYGSVSGNIALDKACSAAGVDLHKVPTGADLSMNTNELKRMIAEDKQQSRVPALCVATLSNEHGKASDDIQALANICKAEGMWLHIEGSLGGSALFLEDNEKERMSVSKVNNAMADNSASSTPQYADSFNMNGSSCFPMGLDMEFLWVKDSTSMITAFAATGDYMPHMEETNDAPYLSKWGIPLGRQFRSLRLWAILQNYGLYDIKNSLKDRLNTITSNDTDLQRTRVTDQIDRIENLEEDGLLTVDLIARYFDTLSNRPVRDSAIKPGSCAAALRQTDILPDRGRQWNEILQDIERFVVPGICHWQHPKFLAFFPSKTSNPAILSEAITAAIGGVSADPTNDSVEDMIESIVMDGLGEAFHLGKDFLHRSGKGGGIIQNTASDALVAVIAAARTRMQVLRRSYDSENGRNVDMSKFVVYMSSQTHFSSEKACRAAGVRLRKIPCIYEKSNFIMDVDLMEEVISRDKEIGLIPILCIANYGTTNTCAIDPLKKLGPLCRKENMLLHVDAAYGGAALILDAFREDADMICSNADSVNINGSKWFGAGFNSAFLWVKDRRNLVRTFGAPNLTVNSKPTGTDNERPNLSSWSLPVYSKFRALRIWATIQYFGIEQLRANVAHDINCAGCLSFPVTNPFGLVCFTALPNTLNDDILRYTENCGFMMFPSKLPDGSPIIRVAFGSPLTTFSHVDELCACIKDAIRSS
ncbi:hypothetical protein FOL47_003234 [Perkinsus chesapeaki]|uniref:Glutamate decarboxylase 2 n=1 Tax=Perkinsus chesapeaki TaxID=330153 RepID=A0A7J6N2N7_PERCH|nr:hypothetical protein FOL47_003234 [Perkinsus chesapeaki]